MGTIMTFPTAPLGYTPVNVIGYAQATSNYASVTSTITDIPGLSVSVVVPEGRRIRVTGYLPTMGQAGAVIMDLLLLMDGAQIQVAESGVAQAISFVAIAVVTPSAGLHTFKAQARAQSGTSTITAGATF